MPALTSRALLAEAVETPLAVAWDAGNGAAGAVLGALTRGLPGRHILLNDAVDGTFPAHHPDPTVAGNLTQLIDTVEAERCDLGIAFDGDGDRIGVVDGTGAILWGDQLVALLAREVLRERPGATVIGDVKASRVLFDEIAPPRGHAAHVADRPRADQGEDGRGRRAARRRDERPRLLRRPLLRLRRRALCRSPPAAG